MEADRQKARLRVQSSGTNNLLPRARTEIRFCGSAREQTRHPHSLLFCSVPAIAFPAAAWSGVGARLTSVTLRRANLGAAILPSISDETVVYMAGERRAQDIDQWRPEESSIRARDRERERPRERIVESRAASPVPHAARDDARRSVHDSDRRPSTKKTSRPSRERSVGRDHVGRRIRGDSREDFYRSSRRAPSVDRLSHSHRRHPDHHHDDHHRNASPSSKRHRSRSPSPHRDSNKRSRRHRSSSPVRSRSRTRRPESPHRPTDRAFSPRLPRSERDRTRRPTPDSYKPVPSARRRSPSAESRYRHVPPRGRKRSLTPPRKSRRDESPRRASPRRHHKQHRTPSEDVEDRRHYRLSTREKESGLDRPSRHAASRSPRRRRSPTPNRKRSPHLSRREKQSPHRHHSSHASPRRRSSPHASRRSRGEDKDHGSKKGVHPEQTVSRKGSPLPGSRYNSDTEKDHEGDTKMRGAYHQHGRGGPHYSHSPSYPASNHHSPHGQSPYNSGRTGWNGPSHPTHGYVDFSVFIHIANDRRSPTHGFSPNQSPYHNNNYSPNHHQPYYSSTQPGPQPSSYRGGFRGNHFNGPDRRISGAGTGTGPGFTPVAGGRGRGVPPTQFSNLSWTPGTGTRGGRPATEAPRHPSSSGAQVTPDMQQTSETQSSAVDADDNPFRPSKDLRVEDEGAKEEKNESSLTKSTDTPIVPKAGLRFSLAPKTKLPLPPKAGKAKAGASEAEAPVVAAKDKESILDSSARDVSREPPRYASDTRHDRDYRDSDRDRDRDYRDRDRRYDKYDDYYDRRPTYRDPRDRDVRDIRDSRDTGYYRDREYRDPRDVRDPRDRDSRDFRDTRDSRDLRDLRDVRDIREKVQRDLQLPRRPDFRSESRADSRLERREPPLPPQQPKTKIIKKKRTKPRPTLSSDFAASESVYYRKPGNESVVGSGTFGKVFKGVHVYTKDMVALKKIRMEGERDGVSQGQVDSMVRH
jgi:CTD kinase subunit alpha